MNVDSLSEESQKELVKIAEKEVEKDEIDTGRIFQYLPRTAELLYESSPTVQKELENNINLKMENGEMFYIGKVLTRGTIINSKLAEFAKAKLDNFIEEKFGLKSDMVLPYNINKHKPPDFESVVKSLEVMEKIEKQRPGGVKFLNDNFGIKEFLRYPPEVLIAQIDEQEINQPYGILVYPRDDHNDAFDADERVIKKIFDQTRNKHGLKIFEAGGKFSLAKMLIKLNKTYGNKNKIAYMLLGGHGTEYKITLGEALKLGKLNSDDLYGRATKKIKDFFVENPTIILESCSTGAEGGIGQQLSKEFEANVIAPKKPTSLKTIQVDYSKKGAPLFSVEYVGYRDDDIMVEYKSGIKSQN